MLATINNATEITVTGPQAGEVLAKLKELFKIKILTSQTDEDEETIPIRETDWWKERQKNRHGNLLAGARLKANLTQKQLAGKSGFTQSVISAYERGTRPITRKAALKLSGILNVPVDYLTD